MPKHNTHNRRQFLKAGLGLLASLPMVGRIAQAQQDSKRKLLIVFARGGWDTTWALDPKPDSPHVDTPPGELRSYARGLQLLAHPDRPWIHTFFEDFGDRASVVNGIETGSIAHPECTKFILTGTNRERVPDIGAISGYALGDALPIPYFILGNTSYTGPLAASSGRAGVTNQMVDLLGGQEDLLGPRESYRLTPDATEQSLIQAYLDQGSARQTQQRATTGRGARLLGDWEIARTRADKLEEFRNSFGSRGLQLSLPQQFSLAAELLEGEVCQALICTDTSPWDTHVNNNLQGQFQNTFYQNLHGLARDLEQRNLLDDTLVMVVSEMGRTPKMNADGGKDHWSVTSSLLFGGGVAGGQIHGATSDKAEASRTNLDTGQEDPAGTIIKSENFLGGVLEVLGVQSQIWYPNANPLLSLKG